MEHRPKIQIQLSTTDKLIEALSFLILFVIWLYTLLSMLDLPPQIPTHFNSSGRPDDFGSIYFLLFMPILAAIIVFGLTILNRFPQLFNFPNRLNAENAENSYRLATRMVRYLKFSVSLVFLILIDQSIQTAKGIDIGLSFWVLPIILALVFVPITIFLKKLFRV